jgi:4-hydroxy-tetrahydrodipicolinate synthase
MLDGNLAEARALHYRYYPLFKGMLSLDVNPVPVKAALAMRNLIPSAEVRLPLVELDPAKAAALAGILAECGL